MLPSSRALRWAWAGILVTALATRLLGLPAILLAPAEAAQALPALDAALAQGWPTTAESPLLLVGNALLFVIFGPGEGVARLLPALAGVALVMLPLLWRKQVGEVGALSSAALILISPLSLFAARRVDGATLSTLGAGLILSFLLQTIPDGAVDERWASAAVAFGVGIGLIGGPAFYDLIVPGVLTWMVLHWSGPRRLAKLSWHPTPILRSAGIGVGCALVISTAFGLRWAGWAGLADGAAAWLAGWRVSPDGLTAVGLLALYEPLLLLLAVVGLILLLRRSNATTPSQWAVAVWPLLALILGALRPGSTPVSLSAVILPTALLGGRALALVASGVRQGSWRWIGLHGLLSFVFWVPGLLALTQHASGHAVLDQTALILLGAGVLLGLQALLVFLFLLPLPPNEVWRSALLGTASVFLVLQVSFATSLAYARADSPVEPAVGEATSPDLAHLRATLQDLSVRRGVRQDALRVSLIGDDVELVTVLRWQLRDFARVAPAAAWPDDPQAIVVAPESSPIMIAEPTDSWRGMSFVATSAYRGSVPRCEQLVPPRCSSGLGWYLYRTTPYPLTSKNVILWQSSVP